MVFTFAKLSATLAVSHFRTTLARGDRVSRVANFRHLGRTCRLPSDTDFEKRGPGLRVLLTGGAGYIGSHVAVELLEQNHTVIVADSLANSSDESLRRVQSIAGASLDFHMIDLTDEEATLALFEQVHVDAVMHFAGSKSVGESLSNPLEYYRNNVGSALSVLSAMKSHGVTKFVFSSSATVYEEPAPLPAPETAATGLRLANPYGRTKAMIESILLDLANADPLFEASILRYFNPVGAHASGLIGEDPRGTPNNLMPFVSQVATGQREKVLVFGDKYDTPDGTGVRDYIHVVDLAHGHIAALDHLSPGVQVFNLGTGRGSSVLEVIAAYSAAAGRTIPFEVVAARDGDVATSYADVSRAETVLGWKATRTLQDSCEDSWRWQSANPDGYAILPERIE